MDRDLMGEITAFCNDVESRYFLNRHDFRMIEIYLKDVLNSFEMIFKQKRPELYSEALHLTKNEANGLLLISELSEIYQSDELLKEEHHYHKFHLDRLTNLKNKRLERQESVILKTLQKSNKANPSTNDLYYHARVYKFCEDNRGIDSQVFDCSSIFDLVNRVKSDIECCPFEIDLFYTIQPIDSIIDYYNRNMGAPILHEAYSRKDILESGEQFICCCCRCFFTECSFADE